MALRAEWHTYRQEGNIRTGVHSIEIENTQGSLSGTFRIDFNEGFKLIDGGKPKDAWPVIQPRSCQFQMFVENDNHMNFVKSIGQSTDISQFIVTYRRWNRVVFVGAILTEAVTLIQGAPFKVDGTNRKNSVVSITAVDGLTFLKSKLAFPHGNNVRNTLIDIITFEMNEMPTWSYLNNNIFLFQTSWVPDTGTANFVLNQSVNGNVFQLIKERLSGDNPLMSWDVLTYVCEAFNMRLRAAYGYYFFQQLEDTSAVSYVYNQSGDYVGTSNTTTYIQDADVDGLNMIDPHIEVYSPPIKRSRVVYHYSYNPNLAFGTNFEVNDYGEQCYTDHNEVDFQGGVSRLRIIGSLEYTPFNGGVDSEGLYKAIFYLKIKLGDQYYVRPLTSTFDYFRPQFGSEQWQSGEDGYYMTGGEVFNMPNDHTRKYYLPIYFSTKYIPIGLAGEDLTICLGVVAYDDDDNEVDDTKLGMITILDDLDITLIDIENQVVEKTSTEVKIENPGSNTKTITREIYFSTGPNSGSDGRITDDSSPPVDTENWTVPGQGTDIHNVQLAKSLMSRGLKGQVWMQTVVEGPYQDLVPLRACGATWVWWTGQYIIDEHQEYHKGEFLQVAIDPVSYEAETNDVMRVLQRPTKPTEPIGGRSEPVEIEVTGITGNRINADTYEIPMPDTTNWSHDEIRNIVTYNQGGNIRKYTENPTIENEFMFDSATRDFVLGENSRANLWHVFRVNT